ncbi:phage tail protein [Paenibacillus silvisoli]|uniref:phage tail protein n=1 Tax=Paenibacillus silvisoli TaxID=3110539 RepID=UPI002805639F|nr:phage tail protein [Paenibacillus silvisoli]
MSQSRLELWDTAGRLAYLPAASSIRIREVLNGEYFISLQHPKVHGNDDRYPNLIVDNEIRCPPDVEGGQRFIIKHESGGRKDRLEKAVEAHHVAFTLGQYFYDGYIDYAAAQMPEPLLNQLFAGTPFSFAIVGSFSPQDIFEWGEKSRLALLHELREIFGAELSFDNQTITFTTRKGANNGEQIRYRKNLKGITRTIHTMDRVTRLYGYGKDGLTVEGLPGQPTKYIDSPYYDPQRPYQAKQEWPEIDDPERLLSAMQKYLTENELPKVSYDVDLVDLSKAGISVGNVGVGDTVRVIDEELGYDFETRVMEHERFPFEPQMPRLVLGNFRELGVSDYLLSYRRKQREIEVIMARRAAEIEEQQTQLEQAQSDLSGYLDGAFKDGVITTAEAKAIAEHKLQLANEKSDVDAEYSNVYANPYLTDAAAKSGLQSAKTAYNTSYSACITAIDSVISDSSITPAERTAVTNAFTDLASKLGALRTAFKVALQAITAKAEGNAKSYADALNQAVQQQLGDLTQEQDNLQTYVDGSFKDGVITTAEAQAIAEHKRQLANEKSDVDAEYTNVYANPYLTDAAAKSGLQSAKTAYNTSYSACITAIDSAISDSSITPAERTAVTNAFTDLASKLGALRTAFKVALQAITAKAEGNAKSYADALNQAVQQQLGDLTQEQADLQTYVDGSFKDGVITTAESQTIAAHKQSLAKEKAELDAEYGKVYNNLYLTNVTLKTALGTSKTNYDTSYTALNTAIDAAIADNAITTTERNNVSAKFTDLNSKLALLRQALQDCGAFISQTAVDKVAGQGILSGGIISLQNRTQTVVKTAMTQASNSTSDTVLNVASTSAFAASGTAYASAANGTTVTDFNYTGKTATTFTGVTGLDVNLPLPASVFLWNQPKADIVVSAMEVIMPDGKYVVIPETRFNNQTLGAGSTDFDGWSYKYLYVDSGGVVRMASAGTSGGLAAYPPNPPAGSIRIGYMLVGYGKEDPDGGLSNSKDFGTDGFPVFKERIYHDVRYRDERAIRAAAGDVAYGGAPYGAQTLAVSVGANSYQTYYVQVGAGRRSVNLSISLDDGSGYDNYTYGAQMTIGRKAANNADGLGRSFWATYVDADGARGHVTGQRNLVPYGVHVLSPRVWNKTYTMLYDIDLMPDPNNGGIIALKLTFRNYGGSAESFSLKLNWHAL